VGAPGNANRDQVPALRVAAEMLILLPGDIGRVKVYVFRRGAVNRDLGDAAVGRAGKDPVEALAFERELDGGAGDVGVRHGLEVWRLEALIALPIAAENDGRIDIVVVAGRQRHQRVGRSSRSAAAGIAGGVEARQVDIAALVLGHGADFDQAGERLWTE